jgi:hypothetical protein
VSVSISTSQGSQRQRPCASSAGYPHTGQFTPLTSFPSPPASQVNVLNRRTQNAKFIVNIV